MIQASELRIGNLVSYYKPLIELPTIDIVTGIFFHAAFKEYACCLNNHSPINVNGLNPIPLTEDWLVKFGFKEVTSKSGILASYILNGIRINISNSGNYYYKKMQILSIHQLQNLIYTLTGLELTY